MNCSRISLLPFVLMLLFLSPAFAQEEEEGHMHGPDGRHIATAASMGAGGGLSILSHHDLKITDARGAVVKECEVNSVIHRKGNPGDVIHREKNAFEPENGVYGSHMVYKEPGEYVIQEKITFPDGKVETVEFPIWVPAVGSAAGHDDHGPSPLLLVLGGLVSLAVVVGAFVLGRRSGRQAAALVLVFALVSGSVPQVSAQEEEEGHMHGPDGRHIATAASMGGGAGGPVLRAYPGPNREASATKTLGAYRLELSIENEEMKPDPAVVTLAEDAREAIDLTVAEAKEGNLGGGLATTGQVRPNPNRAVTVNARVGGRIVQVGLTPGDEVRAGHVVAIIDSTEIAQARAALLRAQGEQQEAEAARGRGRAQVAEARAGLERTQAEASLAQGRVASARRTLERQRQLATAGAFAQGPVESARSAVAAAEGELKGAQTALATLEAQATRLEAGVRDGVVARKEVEAAQSAAAQGRTRAQTAQRQLEIARQALTREERIQREGLRDAREVQQARAELEAAEAAARAAKAVVLSQRRTVQAAQSTQAEVAAALARARSTTLSAARHLQVLGAVAGGGSRVTVAAPIGGEVESRPISVGQMVEAGQTLASILNTDTVWVESDVFEKDLPKVRVGQRVRIAADAAPNRTFAGTVSYIGGEVNPETRAVRVRTVVSNPREILKPNMFVRVIIAATGTQEAVTVPQAAVQEDGAEQVVFIEEAPGAYRRRPVTVGATLGDQIVVEAGLLPGEKVVTKGAYQLLSQVKKG